ncbi:MAG: hypothetical protein H6661_13945 [Ardenticatenaceae bacterium]|nr:hypothetical protein [Ardenticatenaceae bacterium]
MKKGDKVETKDGRGKREGTVTQVFKGIGAMVKGNGSPAFFVEEKHIKKK